MRELIRLIAGESQHLSDADWRRLLATADRTQSTLCLADTPELPDWLRSEVEQRIQKNRLRRQRVLETYGETAEALTRAKIEFAVIKGFTHELDAGWNSDLRVQNDIDLLLPKADVGHAQRALTAAGFVFHAGSDRTDIHSRPLLKPHSWRWQGDYFDPEIPVPVELHHTIWSEARDRIPAPGLGDFWSRRASVAYGNLQIPALASADRLCIAALHFLRHILRNDLRPSQAQELHRMLGRRANDEVFWQSWEQHPVELRRLQALAFRLVTAWFGSSAPARVREEWGRFPDPVQLWFETHAWSPVDDLTSPNKQVLRLHLALIPRRLDKIAVVRKKLLPIRVPSFSEEGLSERVRYHAVALARALWDTLPNTARSRASQTSD